MSEEKKVDQEKKPQVEDLPPEKDPSGGKREPKYPKVRDK